MADPRKPQLADASLIPAPAPASKPAGFDLRKAISGALPSEEERRKRLKIQGTGADSMGVRG